VKLAYVALTPRIAAAPALRPELPADHKALNRNAKTVIAVSIAAWAIVLVFGLRTLLVYAHTPGRLASPPSQWPMASPVGLARGRASLLVFAHPQCPCSRATLGELEKILACCRKQVEVTVFFYRPRTAPKDWAETDLWRTAAAMPGVRVLEDPDADIARLFGAQVSGQVVLYDVSGRLAFNGGITAFRGHSGDNDGSDAVMAIASHQVPRRRATPVFGCALYALQ
jgi:hypothetical protein